MAWAWSHTAEAYENARNNLHNKDRDFLNVCYAEWRASKPRQYGGFEFISSRYPLALLGAKNQLADDIIADAIWERAEENAICDNGGFNAWVCPFGCHTVSFDCEAVESEDV